MYWKFILFSDSAGANTEQSSSLCVWWNFEFSWIKSERRVPNENRKESSILFSSLGFIINGSNHEFHGRQLFNFSDTHFGKSNGLFVGKENVDLSHHFYFFLKKYVLFCENSGLVRCHLLLFFNRFRFVLISLFI